MPSVADALVAAVTIQAEVLADRDLASSDPAVTLPIMFSLSDESAGAG